MATGKKDGNREAEPETSIEPIRKRTWKTGQTLPKLSARGWHSVGREETPKRTVAMM